MNIDSEEHTVIPLTSDRQIGPTLARLRRDAGLTVRQLATRLHVSPSGVAKREKSQASYHALLIDTAHVLGFAVALVPQRHPGARPTGTGWPA